MLVFDFQSRASPRRLALLRFVIEKYFEPSFINVAGFLESVLSDLPTATEVKILPGVTEVFCFLVIFGLRARLPRL